MSRARDFADLAGAADAGGLTGRNLIINGAGQIDQKGLGTVTGVTNTLQRHIDRWYTQLGSGATISTGASTDVPSGQGFTNSINATVTSAGSMSASYIFIQQIIEGYNIKALQAATGIKTFTVSFWVKSSVTGTYTASIQSSNYDYSYNGTYTVDAANTWEYKTVTVPATTNGTWNYTNTAGLNLRMCLGSSGSGTANTWVSGSHNGATTAVDWANNASATFYLTGVQLEVGEQATPFEHRSYADELERCKRYFQQIGSGYGKASSTSAFDCFVTFNPPMRANPTVSDNGTVIQITNITSADFNQSSVGCSDTDTGVTDGTYGGGRVRFGNFTSLTSGETYCIDHTSSQGGAAAFDAEL